MPAITKDFLQARIGSMQKQLGNLLGQVAHVEGAIGDCELLVRYLDAPEPPDSKETARVAKAAENERILKLQHMIYDCSDGQEKLAVITEARIDSE